MRGEGRRDRGLKRLASQYLLVIPAICGYNNGMSERKQLKSNHIRRYSKGRIFHETANFPEIFLREILRFLVFFNEFSWSGLNKSSFLELYSSLDCLKMSNPCEDVKPSRMLMKSKFILNFFLIKHLKEPINVSLFYKKITEQFYQDS